MRKVVDARARLSDAVIGEVLLDDDTLVLVAWAGRDVPTWEHVDDLIPIPEG